MADGSRDIAITLGGQPYTLRMTFAALVEIERATGSSIVSLLRAVSAETFKMSDAAIIITAGLKAAGEPAYYDKVGAMILEQGLEGLVQPIAEFLLAACKGARNDADD